MKRANYSPAPRLTLRLEERSIFLPNHGQGVLVRNIEHVVEVRDENFQFLLLSLCFPVSAFLQVEALGVKIFYFRLAVL